MLLPAAVRDKVRADFRRVAAGDAIADFENVVVRPDGRVHCAAVEHPAVCRQRRGQARRRRRGAGHHRAAARGGIAAPADAVPAGADRHRPRHPRAAEAGDDRGRGAAAHRGSAAVPGLRGDRLRLRGRRGAAPRRARRSRRPDRRDASAHRSRFRRRPGRTRRAGGTLARAAAGRAGSPDWLAADQPPERRGPRDGLRDGAGERGRRSARGRAPERAAVRRGPRCPSAARGGVGPPGGRAGVGAAPDRARAARRDRPGADRPEAAARDVGGGSRRVRRAPVRVLDRAAAD